MGTVFRRGDAGGSGGCWYAEFINENGKRVKRSTKTRHRPSAMKILAKWEDEVARRKAGLIDPRAERLASQSGKSLSSHLDEWQESLKAKGRSTKYVEECRKQWDRLLESTEWTSLADITPEGLEKFLNKMQTKARTRGSYIQAARGFVRWAIKTSRLNHDPLLSLSVPNPELDRKFRRRMLLPEEWPHLRNAISGTIYSMPAEERKVLYELAIVTGLRSNEIRQLACHNLHAGRQPYVSLAAHQAKSKVAAKQLLTQELHKSLQAFLKKSGRDGTDLMFDLCFPTSMAKMARADLAAARKAWIGEAKADKKEAARRSKSDFLLATNYAGQTFDFHSFRHTCGAWLAIQGCHPKTIQTIMRHSTITLTLDTYGHLMPGADQEAISGLSEFLK